MFIFKDLFFSASVRPPCHGLPQTASVHAAHPRFERARRMPEAVFFTKINSACDFNAYIIADKVCLRNEPINKSHVKQPIINSENPFFSRRLTLLRPLP
jgi:hypothetical protein